MKADAVWIGKAICLASRYPFFDYFQQILEDLYLRVKPASEQKTLLEQHIFQIVLTIPVPNRDGKKIKYPLMNSDTLDIFLPSIDELPYCDHSFFTMLLDYISPDHIIEIFTNMLFEQKTLLICPTHEMLMPIATALHSLIYPF